MSAALLYGVLWTNNAPDIDYHLVPWLEHIRSAGPLGAFSTPFSNYTPPYLYLLAAASGLGWSTLNTVKLLAVLSALALSLSAYRLVATVRPDKAVEAGALAMLLPSVVINGPLLGQCDGFWVAACAMSVAAAIEGKTLRMALWAGLGFAVKAQAIFLAPFALAVALHDRKWIALLIPPAVYFLAIAPAWLAGWPMSDLLTIYLMQFQTLYWLGTAPNVWALPAALIPNPPYWLFLLGYGATVTAAAAYLATFRSLAARSSLIWLALLSAILIPWIMPKMHERYFLLADILSFAAVFIDRRAVPIFLCVLLGSTLSLMAYVCGWMPLNVLGFFAMTAALVQLLRLLAADQAVNALQPAELRAVG